MGTTLRVGRCAAIVLGRRTANAAVISGAGLRIDAVLATYIDKVSEAVVSAYESEKENWLRNQSAARAGRVRALLRNGPLDVGSCKAVLNYRLRKRHLGVVIWMTGTAASRSPASTRMVAALERQPGGPPYLGTAAATG